MTISVDANNTITGKYRSFAGKDTVIRDLAGRTHSPRENEKQMLSFAVCYEDQSAPQQGYGHFSACAWSGWLSTEDGTEKIRTFWILTSSPLTKENEWSSHLLGEDVFDRVSSKYDETAL